MTNIFILIVVVFTSLVLSDLVASNTRPVNNGCSSPVVALHCTIKKTEALVQLLKELFARTSELMFQETQGRGFFQTVIIVIPPTNQNRTERENITIEHRYSTADVRIGPPGGGYDSSPHTVGAAECGQRGLYIQLSPEFLLNRNIEKTARALQRQWNIYRQGLCKESDENGITISGLNRFRSAVLTQEKDANLEYNKSNEEPEISSLSNKKMWLPRFHVIEAGAPPRCVLILDISGSMHGILMKQLDGSAGRFVQNIEDGTLIAIVTFANRATVSLPLTRKSTDTIKLIQAKIPTEAFGATAIGDGLKKGLEVLGDVTKGARFLLISDGDENSPCRGPCIDDVWKDVKEAGVIVDTIALGSEASSRLEDMSFETGGKSHFVPIMSSDGLEHLEKPFFYFVQTLKSDINLIDVMVLNIEKLVNQKGTKVPILIDNSIGRNTRFTFITTRFRDLEVELLSPSLIKYTLQGGRCGVKSKENMVVCRFPEAETGNWTVHMQSSGAAMVFIIVTSELRSFQTDPFTVEVETRKEVRHNKYSVVVEARVKKGTSPVTGATVEALIWAPLGDRLTLNLNETSDHGIYEGVLTNLNKTGRYGVELRVTNHGEATIETGNTVVQMAESFSRMTSGGVFKTTNDTLPDSVEDLRIVKTWRSGKMLYVDLEWTSHAVSNDECRADLHVYYEYSNHTAQWQIIKEINIVSGSLGCGQKYRKQKVTFGLQATDISEGQIISVGLRIVTEKRLAGKMSKAYSNLIYEIQEISKRTSLLPSSIWIFNIICVLFCFISVFFMITRNFKLKHRSLILPSINKVYDSDRHHVGLLSFFSDKMSKVSVKIKYENVRDSF